MHDIIGCFLVIFKFVLSRVEYSWFDWDQAYFTRETYITPEGREIRADVVCVAPFKPHIQKRFHKLGFKNIKNFKFIFLLEHKAQNAFDVCKQLAQVVFPEAQLGISIVLPIVVYHGLTKWTAPRSWHEYLKAINPLFKDKKLYNAFGRHMPNFEYRLLDLNKMSLKELIAKGLTYGVFLYILKMIWALGKGPKKQQQVLEGLFIEAQKLPAAIQAKFMQRSLTYVCHKYPLISKEVVVKAATKIQSKKFKDPVEEFYDYCLQPEREKGLKQGLKQGVAKGRKEGRQEGVKQGRKEGVKQGRQEGQKGILINLLDHMPPRQVAKMTKLPLKEVLKVKK